MKILMGTKNPGKIEGARQAFSKYFKEFEIEGIEVNSEVGAQPFNKEILLGAKNRVKNLKQYAQEHNMVVDFFIASEAGITDFLGDYIAINLAIVENSIGFQSTGISQGFPIPERYREEIKQSELGKVMDRIFDEEELNKGKGGISILTHNQITRIDLTRNAFIMALISHINGETWR